MTARTYRTWPQLVGGKADGAKTPAIPEDLGPVYRHPIQSDAATFDYELYRRETLAFGGQPDLDLVVWVAGDVQQAARRVYSLMLDAGIVAAARMAGP